MLESGNIWKLIRILLQNKYYDRIKNNIEFCDLEKNCCVFKLNRKCKFKNTEQKGEILKIK